MTKQEFLLICDKYNLVTKQNTDWRITAYLPEMVYEPDDENNDSFADFVTESLDDDYGTVKMYSGLEIEYNAVKHTTTYNYDRNRVVETSIPSKFEQIVAGVMERYNTMKLLDKKESERTKLIKLQTDFE